MHAIFTRIFTRLCLARLSISMFVASFITILANSLLLLAFFIDPLKIFRNSTTYFIIGLSIVDLLTALVQEPAACMFHVCLLLAPFEKEIQTFMIAVTNVSAQFNFSISASFLMVFAFTVTQYFVVSSPLKYGRLATKTKVLVSVVVIYLYTQQRFGACIWWACLHSTSRAS